MISHPAKNVGAVTHTHKHARATVVYWNSIFWFLLSSQIGVICVLFPIQLINHPQSSELRFLTWRWMSRKIPQNAVRLGFSFFQSTLVQSISANTISKNILPLDDIIKSLLAFLCLAFGEICPASKIYNELPGMFRINQTLKGGREKRREIVLW